MTSFLVAQLLRQVWSARAGKDPHLKQEDLAQYLRGFLIARCSEQVSAVETVLDRRTYICELEQSPSSGGRHRSVATGH